MRVLGWLGLGVLVAGVLAAWLMRLFLPTSQLRFDYASDPAATVLVVTVFVALFLFVASAFLRWQQAREARLLAHQLTEQETERRRFIQRLDHELKNPLTAIQVQLDNLQAIASDNTSAITEVRAQADRLAQLTRGLRRLADLQTRPLEMERIQIEELMEEVVELLQAPERIALEVQRVPWPIPPFRGDRELLLMVFRNLVDNALKYSRAPVQVNARDASGALLVEVVDTGRGIPAADLPHVTSELYRGANTHDVAGSGLGLSIAQRIVERHGGRLELRSKPGQGTIATVQLPYEPEAAR
jgi:two-component system OmpR family sensor kinase